jgi:outer membrane lipoprotein SlyB
MKHRSLLLLGALLLYGCGGDTKDPSGTNGTYGMMSNDRIFGVVVSVTTETEKPSKVPGIVANSAGAATNSTLQSAPTGYTSPTGMVSGWFGSFLSSSASSTSSSLTGPSSPNDATAILHYVIQKDDGAQVKVDQMPAEGDPICYPGQRVMIQANGQYFKVYPTDVEDPLPQHVPGGPRTY